MSMGQLLDISFPQNLFRCGEASSIATGDGKPQSVVATDLERAQNKAAQKVRARAHAARYKELTQAISAAEAAPEVMQVRRELDQINSTFNGASLLRDLEIASLQARIAELQKRIDELTIHGVPHELIAQRNAAVSRWNAAKARSVAKAESQFPDMQGNARFSSTAWQPPQVVIDAMEEARRTATVGDGLPVKKRNGSSPNNS